MDPDHDASLADRITELVGQPLLRLGADLAVEAANPAFLRHFGLTAEETVGRRFGDLGDGSWNETALRQMLDDIRDGDGRIDGLRIASLSDGTVERTLWVDARWLAPGGSILLAIRDVTGDSDVERRDRTEARQKLLVEMSDCLRALADPQSIMALASELLGRHFGARQVAYAEIDATGRYATIAQDWNDGSTPSNAGRHDLATFGTAIIGDLSRGATVAVADVRSDPRTAAPAALAAFGRISIGAFLIVPLIKGGRLLAALATHTPQPRSWSAADVALVEEIAERTWAAVEQTRAEQKLRESEKKYRTLFESIDEGFCIIDVFFDDDRRWFDYRFVEVNTAFERQTGIVDAPGRTMRAIAPQHEEHWFEAYREIARSGRSQRFEAGAFALGRHFDVFAFKVGRPGENLVAVLFNEISERKRREERIDLLMREVNHRSKNILGIVQAIARRTAASGYDNFVPRFEDRIRALSASQDLLIKNQWEGVDLEELARSQLAHSADLIGKRILLHGPRLTVKATASQTIGMVLHELCTNAGKYGALANECGRVEIGWRRYRDSSGAEKFSLDWRESGGPPVVPPTRRGFGSTVIGNMARVSLDADILLEYAPTGLVWRLECMADEVIHDAAATNAISRTAAPERERHRTAVTVLVVEDEALLAMDIADVLREAGFEVLGPASTVVQALALLERTGCDVAVLDVNLGDETAEPVAERLTALRIPFAVLSGYSREQQPAVFRGMPQLTKPLQPDLLLARIREIALSGAAGSTEGDDDDASGSTTGSPGVR